MCRAIADTDQARLASVLSITSSVSIRTFACPLAGMLTREDEVEIYALQARQLRLVLAWAELHREELVENWRRARAGETLNPIDPLR